MQNLLDAIDNKIIDTMFENKVEPIEPDEIGRCLQRIYDDIYYQENNK